MTPISPKRSTPCHSDDRSTEEPTSKRICGEPTLPRTPPSEEDLNIATPTRMAMFDDDPHQLLLRSVALALEHVGFTGASQEALEAMCAEVETCEYSVLFIVFP